MGIDTTSKWKSSIDRGIAALSIKTSSSLERAKLKTHIDTLNEEIKELKYVVGGLVYEQWVCESQDNEGIQKQLKEIKTKIDEVEKLRQELADLETRERKILGDGKRNFDDPDTDEQKFCSQCGTGYSGAVNFCRKCGNKLTV